MVRRRRDPTKGAPTHNNWTRPKTLLQGTSPAAPFLLLQVNISSFSSDYVCAVAVIDVPLLIRQLNQRHMTGCAVLLNIIMWWVKSARQPSGLYWTACRFVIQLCKLITKHVRFLSRLFTWVDCSAGDARSSEKGQMRERRLEKSRELHIVKSDSLLSIHWFSFVLAQSTCAAALSRFASLTRTHSVNQLRGAYSQFKALLGSHSNT